MFLSLSVRLKLDQELGPENFSKLQLCDCHVENLQTRADIMAVQQRAGQKIPTRDNQRIKTDEDGMTKND
jgi:hypothetical protein